MCQIVHFGIWVATVGPNEYGYHHGHNKELEEFLYTLWIQNWFLLLTLSLSPHSQERPL